MTTPPSDTDDLVRRARGGDGQALAALFVRYRQRLRQMVRLRLDRRLQGRLDPSDVLQEAYLDLASDLEAYLRDPKLGPLMAAWGIAPFAFAGYSVALPLWAGVAFGWREQQLGWLFSVIGATAAVVQGYLFGKLARRVGDRRLLIAGGFGMALGIAVIPALHTTLALRTRARFRK